MIYILIIMWYGSSTSYSGKAALAVEFNDLQSCQAAAAEIRTQQDFTHRVGTVLCAQKGAKK
jgi:hypothetical protein